MKGKQKEQKYYVDKGGVALWVWFILGFILMAFQSGVVFIWLIISIIMLIASTVIKKKK